MKQIWKWIIVIPIVVGIIVAISISYKNQAAKIDEQEKLQKVFGNLATANAEVTKFYTYGTNLNVEGKIKNVAKENFEGAKLVIKDGINFERTSNLSYAFEDNFLIFSSDEINNAINLDELEVRKILCSN